MPFSPSPVIKKPLEKLLTAITEHLQQVYGCTLIHEGYADRIKSDFDYYCVVKGDGAGWIHIQDQEWHTNDIYGNKYCAVRCDFAFIMTGENRLKEESRAILSKVDGRIDADVDDRHIWFFLDYKNFVCPYELAMAGGYE
jgi:hypothetical protein